MVALNTEAPIAIEAPDRQIAAIVVASPHSGDRYPEDFLRASRLDARALRQSEDCFVDQIFGAAPALGIPLLKALFPRAYVDPNREPWELDPAMFEDELPNWINRNSPRVAVGLGTIARVVADRQPIYRRKLQFSDAERRIETCYKPYHEALEHLVATTVTRFGACILVDAHSMPSQDRRGRGGPANGVDVVLGDRIGTACDPVIVECAERTLLDKGYSVVRNAPYAGGFTTGNYGQPTAGRHGLQIEINRAIYMDEQTLSPRPAMAAVREHMTEVLRALAELDLEPLRAR